MKGDQLDRIHELLKQFDTAMLVTQGQEACPRGRPMAIAKVEPNCGLWFFTGTDTGKVHAIKDDQQVLVVCQDEHSRYVALQGVAELVANRQKAHELWREPYRTWFPQGVDDPELLLIFVRPTEVEYWNSRGIKGLRYMFEAVKSYATGTRPQVREGEQHGRVVVE